MMVALIVGQCNLDSAQRHFNAIGYFCPRAGLVKAK
jgi:hypothetical protein